MSVKKTQIIVNEHKFLHVFGILLLPLQRIFRISDINSNKVK